MTPRVLVVNCPHCGEEVACLPIELAVELGAQPRRMDVQARLRGQHACGPKRALREEE